MPNTHQPSATTQYLFERVFLASFTQVAVHYLRFNKLDETHSTSLTRARGKVSGWIRTGNHGSAGFCAIDGRASGDNPLARQVSLEAYLEEYSELCNIWNEMPRKPVQLRARVQSKGTIERRMGHMRSEFVTASLLIANYYLRLKASEATTWRSLTLERDGCCAVQARYRDDEGEILVVAVVPQYWHHNKSVQAGTARDQLARELCQIKNECDARKQRLSLLCPTGA